MRQDLSQMKGGDAEREADERNVIMDDHPENSHQRLCILRYEIVCFRIKPIMKYYKKCNPVLLSKSSDNESGKHRASKLKERVHPERPETQVKMGHLFTHS